MKTKAVNAVVAWTEAETRRAKQNVLTVAPGAATSNMMILRIGRHAIGRPLWIDARAIGIIVFVIPITALLPYIAVHIH